MNGLNRYFFLSNYASFVVQFTFMPVSMVEQMRLSSCWTSCNLVSNRFDMRSALVATRFGGFALWMCHFLFISIVNSNFSIPTIAGLSVYRRPEYHHPNRLHPLPSHHRRPSRLRLHPSLRHPDRRARWR